MHDRLRDHNIKLPVFTDDELALLKGSLDFVGVNQYSSRYIAHGLDCASEFPKRHRLVQAKGRIPSLPLSFLQASLCLTRFLRICKNIAIIVENDFCADRL